MYEKVVKSEKKGEERRGSNKERREGRE